MKILARLAVLIPLKPRIFSMVESSQSCLNNLKRLTALTNTNNLTGLNAVRSNSYNLSINNDVTMVNQLTSSSTRRSNAKTVYDIVETALEILN
jgi:hypothetical protein